MNKYKLFGAALAAMILFTACESAPDFAAEDYTFPPEEVREMEWALDEAGLDYTAEDARMTTDRIPDDIAIMRLTREGGKTMVMLNMLLYGGAERQCSVSFGYNQQPGDEEQLSEFVEEEWPLFWKLTGLLFEAPEEVSELGRQCMEHFGGAPPQGGDNAWEWSGSEGEVRCDVSYFLHPGFNTWLPGEIRLSQGSRKTAEQ